MPRVASAAQHFDRVRALCLALPETREAPAWGHPAFRAGTKTFVSFEQIQERPSIAFRLDPVDIDLLQRTKGFFATPYGRGLWASVWADAPLDWSLIADLVTRSYRLVALKRMVRTLESGEAGTAKRPTRPRAPAKKR